jgi:hypothetical protein
LYPLSRIRIACQKLQKQEAERFSSSLFSSANGMKKSLDRKPIQSSAKSLIDIRLIPFFHHVNESIHTSIQNYLK